MERDKCSDWVKCGESLSRVDTRNAGKAAGLWASKQRSPRWRFSSRTRRRSRGVLLTTSDGDKLPIAKGPTLSEKQGSENQEKAGLLFLVMSLPHISHKKSCCVKEMTNMRSRLEHDMLKPVFPHRDHIKKWQITQFYCISSLCAKQLSRMFYTGAGIKDLKGEDGKIPTKKWKQMCVAEKIVVLAWTSTF